MRSAEGMGLVCSLRRTGGPPGRTVRWRCAALPLAALMFLMLASCGVRGAGAEVIASSRLEACTQETAAQVGGERAPPSPPPFHTHPTCPTPQDQLACEQRLVITLSVPSGQALETERLELSVGCVGRYGGAN